MHASCGAPALFPERFITPPPPSRSPTPLLPLRSPTPHPPPSSTPPPPPPSHSPIVSPIATPIAPPDAIPTAFHASAWAAAEHQEPQWDSTKTEKQKEKRGEKNKRIKVQRMSDDCFTLRYALIARRFRPEPGNRSWDHVDRTIHTSSTASRINDLVSPFHSSRASALS